jgi:hypothetical protein
MIQGRKAPWGTRIVVMLGMVASAALLAACEQRPNTGASVKTEAKLMGPDPKIVVESYDDPKIDGITVFISKLEIGRMKGAVGLSADTSDVSVAVRQTGPIKVKEMFKNGEDAFAEKRSVLSNRPRVSRFWDAPHKSFVYVVWTDRRLNGLPQTSLSAVVAQPWGTQAPDLSLMESAPSRTPSLTPKIAVDESAGTNIGVYGDSLGDGVWSGLYTIIKHNPNDKLFRYSKVGAGLTRPNFASWFDEFKTSLDRDHITTAVFMFGANDQQGIRDEKHKGYIFESRGWKEVYISRIDAILSELSKRRVTAIWIGLPVMRSKDENAGALFLDGIFSDEAKKFDIVFLPLSDSFVDSEGQFAIYLPDQKGHLREVRVNDGVHFTGYGYGLIADKVYSAITTPVPANALRAPNP